MQRLFYIDAFRACLILLVVLGHAIQTAVPAFDDNIVFRGIYSFHMAAFMFVSGFVNWKGGIVGIDSKLRRLLVPFVAWWFISSLLSFSTFAALGESFLHLFRHPDSGLWFLYVLAICQSLVWLVGKICRNRGSLLVAMLLAVCLLGIEAVTQCKEFGYHLLAWYFPFFLAGCVVRRFEHALDTLPVGLIGTAALSVWIPSVFFWHREGCLSLFGLDLPLSLSFACRFVVASAGTAAFFGLSRRFLPVSTENFVAKAFARLGGLTLGVYAVHGMLLRMLIRTECFTSGMIGVIGIFAIAAILSILVVLVMRKTPYVRRIV